MNIVLQPANSSLCGQACVAMLAGVTLEKALAGFRGKISKTSGTDLRKALEHFGLSCGKLKRQNPCGLGVMRFKWFMGGTHWVVYDHGRIFDPLSANIMNIMSMRARSATVVSFMEVRRKES